jgi:peptidoglycan hydrolase-like protein with peptidoglycan-binding domain
LGYGSQNSVEVSKLQNFLIVQGYLHTTVSGNYLAYTRQAVAAFQANHGIQATGYFGPLTRATANTYAVQTAPSASVSTVSVKNANTGLVAGVLFSNNNTKIITWATKDYPTNAGVNINLIRKTSDSPQTFTLVRTIATNAPNTGQYIWTLQTGDTGNGLYVEIACSSTYVYSGGCQLDSQPMPVQ